MTATRPDIRITSDLAALAEDSRKELRPLAHSMPAGAYRDDRPGAEGRRDALLDQRRRELALMPLALSQVFAHRVGRAAAGLAAMVSAAGVAMLLSDPLLAQIAAAIVPGLNIPMLVTLVGAKILATYVCASWIAERVFERRMRRAITIAGDAYADLDHLAEGPIDVGRTLVRRADKWAVMGSLAGACTAVPVLGFLLFVLVSSYPYPRMWTNLAVLVDGPLGEGVGPVILATVLAVAGAILTGRACDRERRRGALPRWARLFGHWAMIPSGIVLGLASMYGGLRMVRDYQVFGIVPCNSNRFGLAVTGVVAVFALASWAVLWWRRVEHARLGDGPGSGVDHVG